jgi:hypothetical protein
MPVAATQGGTAATGSQGASGPAGVDGVPGATGTPGAPGAPGPAGATGSTGGQGPAGLPGVQGPPGPPGTPGATGPAGPVGADSSPYRAGSRLTVHRSTLTGADGSVGLLRESLRDPTLGADCSLVVAEDGTIRCAPEGPSVVAGSYRDAACLFPLLALSEMSWCPGVSTHGRESLTVASCLPGAPATRVRVWSLGAVHSGAIYRSSAGGCYSDTRAAGVAYVERGAMVTPASMVAF